MKLSWMIVLLFLFTASTFAAQSGMNPAGQAFVKAVKAGDIEAIAALYAEDATTFPPDLMVAKGRDAIRKIWADVFAKYTAKIELTDGFYETHGDISIAWGQFTMTLTPKSGGEPIKMEGRYTDVSKLEKGKWRYIVDHGSLPIPPPPASQTMQH